MPKLPSINARQVFKALKGAGFYHHHTRGSHYYYYHSDSKRMATVPFHRGTIKRGTLRSIIKQTGLTVEKFINLL